MYLCGTVVRVSNKSKEDQHSGHIWPWNILNDIFSQAKKSNKVVMRIKWDRRVMGVIICPLEEDRSVIWECQRNSPELHFHRSGLIYQKECADNNHLFYDHEKEWMTNAKLKIINSHILMK